MPRGKRRKIFLKKRRFLSTVNASYVKIQPTRTFKEIYRSVVQNLTNTNPRQIEKLSTKLLNLQPLKKCIEFFLLKRQLGLGPNLENRFITSFFHQKFSLGLDKNVELNLLT